VLDASGTIHARCPTLAGPDGVAVDDAHGQLYVVGRFRNQIQTLSSASLQSLGTTAIGFDPTPDPIVNARKFFYGGFTSGHRTQATDGAFLRCNDCHTGTNFGPGTNGQIINHTALQEAQDMKVPQLRNLYKKTGFTDQPGVVNKRGFGFTHNGAVDNLFDFLH